MEERDRSKVEELIHQIIASGTLTTDEKRRLDELVLDVGELTLEERRLMDKLLGMIARGELAVGD